MFAPDEFDRRLARTRAEMEARNIDLLLVDHAEFLQWLTGYTVSETMYRCALLPAEGDPWIVLRALDEGPARAQSWIDTVIGYADWKDPYTEVAASVLERGYGSARLGVDPQSYGFTVHTRDRLAELLPEMEYVPVPGISDRLRAVKSPAEIAVLERASGMADTIMESIRTQFRAGMSARDAGAIAAAGIYHCGADPTRPGPIVAARGHSEFLHAALDSEPLGPGAILHVELTPRVGGYGARLMRPIVIGQPDGDMQETAERLIAWQDEQFCAMRPGMPAKDVDALLRTRVLEEGLRETYDNVTGYTLGLYARTPRPSDFSHVFHPGADWILEEGMVFHMYASARGLAFSETVAVTAQGGQRLTRTPRRLLTCQEA